MLLQALPNAASAGEAEGSSRARGEPRGLRKPDHFVTQSPHLTVQGLWFDALKP